MENASKEILLNSVVELFKNDDFEKDFVKKLNDQVDVPFINEKTEKKIIKSIYKLVVEQVELAVEKIQKED
jgi:hypothetical protein